MFKTLSSRESHVISCHRHSHTRTPPALEIQLDMYRHQTDKRKYKVMNKLSRANRGVQTVRKTGEDIEEQIINHLVKNGNIGKYQIEHISRGNAGFSENNSVILSWQEETYPENFKLLREKISAKPNQDLNYTSPIEIFDPRSEKLVNSRDGILPSSLRKIRTETLKFLTSLSLTQGWGTRVNHKMMTYLTCLKLSGMSHRISRKSSRNSISISTRRKRKHYFQVERRILIS